MNVSLKQQESVAGREPFVDHMRQKFSALRDRTILFLLSRMTNTHTKRILFLTSLYCRIVRLEHMRDDTINQLNDLLKLAKRREALRLPAAVQGIVWTEDLSSQVREELHQSQFDEAKAANLARQVIDSSKAWMRYGQSGEMERDIMKMFRDIHKCGHEEMAAA